MITLDNGIISAAIKPAGAELCSLKSNVTGIEYLWQAGQQWPKHAPVLFPVVGALKNGTYIYNGVIYNLSRHGFAREKMFTPVFVSGDKSVFQLKWNAETLKVYPFHFILDIIYTVSNDFLTVEYQVRHESKRPMYFSIGGHPAFRVPLLEGESYSDYYLKFNRPESAPRWKLADGLPDHSEPFFKGNDTIELNHGLFTEDALVFKNLQSDKISLKSRKNNHGLDFIFKGFPYFGIWSSGHAEFICLEPWHGIADSIHAGGELEKKEGIVRIENEEVFSCSYSLRIY